jgi:hypothetical protein
MNMLRTAVVLLFLFAASAIAGTAGGMRDAGQVAAFARLYGVVRHFHPGDALQEVDWNRFAIYGVQQVRAAPDRQALGQVLRELFLPIAPGVQIVPQGQPFPPLPPPVADPSRILWQHRGYADGVSPYTNYQAKRTHRAGVAASNPVTPTPPGTDYDAPEAVLYPVPAALGRVVDFPLGEGWKTRVPLDLAPADALVTPAQRLALDTLKARMDASVPPPEATPLTPAQREADVLVAWNVYKHFYPYWMDVDVDWDAQLLPLLREADRPATRGEHRDLLRHLVSLVQDGHGQVSDRRQPLGGVYVRVEPIEGQLIIVDSRDPAVKPGDRIVGIGGKPVGRWLDRELRLASGSVQWRPWRAIQELTYGPRGSALPLRLERGGRLVDVTLHYDRVVTSDMSNAVLPAPIAELRPRVWYVDLARVVRDDLQRSMDRLAYADAVLFDMRRYPKDVAATFDLLQQLIDHEEHAKWAHMAFVDGPFQQVSGYDSQGWDLQPMAPRLRGRIVFLAGGGTLSFGDSVLSYVDDEHLGIIVGSRTAGTSGDVQAITTPANYQVRFSGLRVTKHDGHTPIHLVGTAPDVWAVQTIAGFRAGRDEVIERALQVVGAR